MVHDLHKEERSVLSMLCLTKNQFSCLHLYFQTRTSFPHFISASCLWHITKKLSIIVCIIFHFLILSYSHVHLISVLLHLLSCAQLHSHLAGKPHENSVFATLNCFFQSLYPLYETSFSLSSVVWNRENQDSFSRIHDSFSLIYLYTF